MLSFADVNEMREYFAAKAGKADREVRILYMGSPDFAVPPLLSVFEEKWNLLAVATQPDKPVGRKQILTAPPLKKAAQKLGIPVYQWQTLRDANSIAEIRELSPDLIITAAYGLIVPEAVLRIPRFGSLNLHPSLLPRFRGASPIASAILSGDRETAASIMLMEKGLDTGDLLAQCRTEISSRENEADLSARLSDLSAELLCGVLPLWIKGEITPSAQAEKGVVYAAKLSREDGRLDFSQAADIVAQRIRACCPWPGTFAYCQGKKYKFIEAAPLSGRKVKEGQIIREGKRLFVGCGEGMIEVFRIQLPSGKILPVSECSHNFSGEHCFVADAEQKEG